MPYVYHAASEFTGTGDTSLATFVTATLLDGKTHICWLYDETTKKVYAYVFDPDSTEAESVPDFIRPNDYSVSGVWVLMHSPFDVSAGVETGSIQMWTTDPGDAVSPTPIPLGYLECDGSAISRTTYADLFSVIGEIYGVGDGVNTFNIPDYRGVFLRGFDNGAGNDLDAASRTDRGDGSTGDVIGARQNNATKRPNTSFTTNNPGTHKHFFTAVQDSSIPSAGGYIMSADYTTPFGTTREVEGGGSHTHSITLGGDNETRPINISVMYIIKY